MTKFFYSLVVGSLAATLTLSPVSAKAQNWVVPGVAPWSSVSNDPSGPGIIDDWLAEVARRAKLNFTVRTEPYARVVQGIKDGALEASVVIRNKAAEAYSDFPACFIEQPTAIIGARGISIKTTDDLYNLRYGVGVIRGLSYSKDFDENPKILRSEEPDFDTIFRKLTASRLDAMIGATVGIMYHVKKSGYQEGFGDRLVLSKVEVCMQTPKGKADTPTFKSIAGIIESMRADGSAAAIVTKYVGTGWQ